MLTLAGCESRLDVYLAELLSPTVTVPPIMSAANISVAEEAGSGVFTVSLDKAYTNTVTIDYALTSQKAVIGEDYSGALPSGVLTFAPGELTKTITVNLLNDNFPENAESILLTLTHPSEGPDSSATATMTITDADANFFGADMPGLISTIGTSHAPTYNLTTTNTLYVDPAGTGGAFTTIQDAMNAAVPGTEILVNNGFYPEALNVISKGNLSSNPIVIKNAPGQTPVISGSDVVGYGSLTNDNTDGQESGTHTYGFEAGALDGFSTYEETGNTVTNFSGVAADIYQGTRSAQVSFSGTSAQAMIWNTFPYMDNLNGSEYKVRFMVKLNSTFALDGSLDTTTNRGMTLMRVERETDTSSRVNLKIFPRSNANQFTLRMQKNNTNVGSNTIITRGNWIKIEFYYKKATTSTSNDGVIKLFVDGVEIASDTAYSISADHNRFRLGSIVSTYVDASNTNCPISTSSSNACVVNGSKINFDAIKVEEGNTVSSTISDANVRTIYENGFEASLADFTAATNGSNAQALSTVTPLEGARTVKMTFNGSSAVNSLRRTFTDASSDIYARVNFRLNSTFNLSQESSKVESPGATSELTREFDLISLYGASGSSGRLKVSLQMKNFRLYLVGKILSINDPSNVALAWTSELDIANYLQIYKGHVGEINRGSWYNLEIRYAGNKTKKSGVEIWLNGVSIASNINHVTKEYSGLLTTNLLVDTIQLGNAVDNNLGGSPVVSMQSTPPTNGSEIEFDGLKVTTGGPAGYSATGSAPVIYRYAYTAPGAGESYPKIMNLDNIKLTSVSSLDQVGPGSFYVNTDKSLVYFRTPEDLALSTQVIFSGRRDKVINISDSANVVFQGLEVAGGNSSDYGCLHLTSTKAIKVLGNTFLGCLGPNLYAADSWNSGNTSDDLLISGNTLYEGGDVNGGAIRISNMGNVKIENNLIRTNSGTGISINCLYDNAGSFNLTNDYCNGFNIYKNIINQSVESGITLNGNVQNARIFTNYITSVKESGYATQSTLGAWVNSGGSGIQVSRESHNNKIYNNLVYSVDTSGIKVHGAAYNNAIFNNTINETGNYLMVGGASLQFKQNSGELNPDHNDPTRNNFSYNNIYSGTLGSDPCLDLEGYGSGEDETNMSNHNIFYSCTVTGRYNSINYSSLATLITGMGTNYPARENLSQDYVGVLFDPNTYDFTLDAGATFTATPYNVRSFMP